MTRCKSDPYVIRGSVNGRPLEVEIGMDFDPGSPDPYIAAHHTCWDGGPCVPCAAWDERLIEIEARERARGRTR